MTDHPLILRIDALLPQTQCGKCEQPGCLPYARAVADGAPHNRCAPGGARVASALAALLDRPALPPEHGEPAATVAWIREADCIGCAKCIAACPVDAIVGAAHLMHTVLADRCTGCDLCLPPCPVDCIEMRPAVPPSDPAAQATIVRGHWVAREARLARERRTHVVMHAPAEAEDAHRQDPPPVAATTDSDLRKLRAAAATLRRQHREAEQALARARRAGHGDLAAMQARVDALGRKAAEAAQAVDDHDSQQRNPT